MQIGDIIKYFRKKRNLTQKKLAEGICSIDYINKLENNKSFPTTYILNLLSDRLEEDIYKCFRDISNFDNFTSYEKTRELALMVNKKDVPGLKDFILENENTKDFQSGESLQIMCYAKAICFYISSDFDKIADICMSGLHVYKKKFNIENLSSSIFSNIELNLINFIAASYCMNNKQELGIEIYNKLCEYLEKHMHNSAYYSIGSDYFYISMYNAVAHNLSSELISLKKYEEALFVVDKSIKISIEANYIYNYPFLLKNKSKILYKLKDYKNSKKYYDKALVYYDDMLSESDLEDLMNDPDFNWNLEDHQVL